MKIRIIFALCFCVGFLFGNAEAENLQKQCEAGYGRGCSILGAMYAEGKEVKKDPFRAVELYQKACDLGNGLGCNNLGVNHYTGEGVKRDLKKAKELFGKACDLRMQEGCENYARMP